MRVITIIVSKYWQTIFKQCNTISKKMNFCISSNLRNRNYQKEIKKMTNEKNYHRNDDKMTQYNPINRQIANAGKLVDEPWHCVCR